MSNPEEERMKRTAFNQFNDMFENGEQMYRDFYPNVEMGFVSSVKKPFFSYFFTEIINLPEYATEIAISVVAVKNENKPIFWIEPSFMYNLKKYSSFSADDIVEGEEFCVEITVNQVKETNEEYETELFRASQLEERVFSIINRITNTEPTIPFKRGGV